MGTAWIGSSSEITTGYCTGQWEQTRSKLFNLAWPTMHQQVIALLFTPGITSGSTKMVEKWKRKRNKRMWMSWTVAELETLGEEQTYESS